MHKVRRNWSPNQPIEIELASRELLMWACLFNQFDLVDEIFNHAGFQEKVRNSTRLEKADPTTDMSLENFTQNLTLNAPISHHTGITRCLGVAYLISNCLKGSGSQVFFIGKDKNYSQDPIKSMPKIYNTSRVAKSVSGKERRARAKGN